MVCQVDGDGSAGAKFDWGYIYIYPKGAMTPNVRHHSNITCSVDH